MIDEDLSLVSRAIARNLNILHTSCRYVSINANRATNEKRKDLLDEHTIDVRDVKSNCSRLASCRD